ncbi:MAG: 4Fe-4S dicluster domain-containing protein [Chthonomonadaceae bacterium]|nr:4Fe-4S dicluster domain-containing protein [Chthonomonadaceae bacterium]
MSKDFIYVKSREQLETPEAFDGIKGDEFPERSSLLDIDRRDLLKFIGGSVALAGLASGCRYLPQQKIVPFVQAPEDRLPGQTEYYASACSRGGYARGVLVKQFEGRPIKIEGNPNHPSSLGATDAMTQAELATMFDPDRSQNVVNHGDVATWEEFLKTFRAAVSQSHNGAGVAILSENVGSPTLASQIRTFLAQNPAARWYQYEPVNQDNALDGSVMAFGQPVETVYDFENADVVVSLDADFFQSGPGNVRYMRDTMKRRDVDATKGQMNRIYAFESCPTLVGASADHRFRVKPSEVFVVAQALASLVGVQGAQSSAPGSVAPQVLQAVANDLKSRGGRAVVIAGPHQSPSVHALAHAINSAIGAVGKTVTYTEPVLEKPVNNGADLKSLTTAMRAGQVQALLILEGNPVWDAPADLGFAEALKKVGLSACVSLYVNETAQACAWHLPLSHWLEAWGDLRGHDGTVSVVQPLINPLFETMSCLEVMVRLNGSIQDGRDVVAERWKREAQGDPADWWTKCLAEGTIPGTTSAPLSVGLVPNLSMALNPTKPGDLELVVLPDPTIYDGRYANLGWMQELPKPLSHLTWDNTFQMSPATAKKLGVGQQDKMLGVQFYGDWSIIKVSAGGATVEGPIFVQPGMADDTIVVHTGYGRTAETLSVAKTSDPIRVGGGFNAYPLRTSDNPWIVTGVSVEKTGKNYKLANTQFHNLLDVTEIDSKRDIIRETTLDELKKHPDVLEHPTTETVEKAGEEESMSLFKPPAEFYSDEQYQWAMTIDLNLCTGCSACVTACQAENNIPTVGKEQTLRHRMLHWIRIDRYYRAEAKQAFDENDPVVTFQPVTCMHCEMAPCEPVCPVAATTHSHEGLNQMVYNRCVGTRYCSNNCPYKVRRFNYLHYTRKVEDVPILKLLQNPDVTVRGRGVMEKCTYCVQRINHARINAKKDEREIKDGEVVTACQQACPSGAIVFGDKRRPANAVSKKIASKRNYVLLKNLNTVPRTTYLGKVRNPNPEVQA